MNIISKVRGILFSCLFLSLCPLSALESKESANQIFYKFENKVFYDKDFSPASQQAIFEAKKLYFENISNIINSELLNSHISNEAIKKNKSKEAVEQELFNAKVSEKDAKAWYEQNKARLGGRDFESIKPDITNFLQRQKIDEQRGEIVAKIKRDGSFSQPLVEPMAPTIDIKIDGYPSKGSKKAKVTLVEFADYQCPHCKEAASVLKSVSEKYKNKIQLVFLDFPLREGSDSELVAIGGVCAFEQGKFWDYHYLAFSKQGEINKDSPQKFAKDLKLNEKKFSDCLKSEKPKKIVDKARAEGERVGVQGTPAIYINGQKHEGYSEESLVKMIDSIL